MRGSSENRGVDKNVILSLLKNRGNGTFDDVTLKSGLGVPIATQAAGWADFDNDGLIDVYVAGEFVSENPDVRNRGRLYRNQGDGTFVDIAAFSLCDNPAIKQNPGY